MSPKYRPTREQLERMAADPWATDREKQAFDLVYRRGWAHEDAAAEMYCSRSTVDRALASIRKRNM